jgi:predicted RNA-binding protein (virulence factor B family)
MTLAIGQFHELTIVELVDNGWLLDGGDRDLFLPTHQVSKGASVGQRIEVFIYADGEGQPQATTRQPAATVGEVAVLECVATTRDGAYLAWGIPKDLYVPPSERDRPMVVGRHYVTAIVLDDRGERLIGSTRVAHHLDYDVSGIAIDQEVKVIVFGHIDAGVQVVVDKRYRGLVHTTKVHQHLPVGSIHRGFVRNIREDNRLDIELTRRGAEGSEDAQAAILAALEKAGGFLPLHDKSPPAAIARALGLSKKAFKRGAGGLYKARRITIDEEGIRLVKKRRGGR